MSVSVTQTHLKKNDSNRGFRQQRLYDYLYDPVCTLSGEVDHARENLRAHASLDRVRKVPEFNSMFSNLPHHPSYTLRLETTDPVPAFIDRQWRGYAEQRRQALQQLTGVMSGVQMHRPKADDVTGADRWKFFRRPMIPFAQQIPPNVVFALPKSDLFSSPDGEEKCTRTPFQRSVGVQTDYRESETQTDPYTPDYVLRPGTAPPELLTLATLTWGRGLPAGLAEVEMIERARMKRAWEKTLPPLDDLTQLEKRRRMMEEMERKEWAYREHEIEKMQEARLTLLKELLRQRQEKQENVIVERLDQSFSQHQKEKEAQLKKIHNDYVVSMRKLLSKRKNVEGKLERRDIIKDYSDYGSQTYAPLSRTGQLPERNSNVVKSHFLNTYQGLLELEAGLPSSVMEPQIEVPKPKMTKGFISRSARRELELMKIHKALKEEEVWVEEKKPLRFLFKMEKPVPRPPSPVVDGPPEGDEEKELAVIFLQKLLRGRSTQNQMFEGKQKRLELIQELRTTHALQREGQEEKEAEKQVTLALQSERDIHHERVSQIESCIDGLSGEVIVDMLDFLSKELIRLQEERRIHAFALLADRNRRIREAEESGKRQIEERRRREEDEIFKQVVKVHHDTVDMYLEDVILNSINETADAQAREEIRHMAEELNNITYAMEETRNSQQSEEIVAELVYRFLIPEVQKISVRDRVRQSQRRHLQAARSIINNSVGSFGVSQSPQSPSPSERASSAVLNEILGQLEEAVPTTVRDIEPNTNNESSAVTTDTHNDDN
ncbi:cilia- and flagella-associated protein 91 isoform X1 [Misgurnus anguillicaudatus]|uniref:cilia- and flagella-associated protein 91 isoform X1 n=1 Tax=Misgurnus anguillicaudatus TaxID=75329 RepID=UPI003CCF85E9